MSRAVSGLSREQRSNARRITVNAAFLAYHHKTEVHYTQDMFLRWEGIRNNYKAWRGHYPAYADCSSFATWCIWNGLSHYGIGDTVNGLDWKAGYTGTMLNNGKQVQFLKSVLRGDCVIYGNTFPGKHTAIVAGSKGGTPMVISHGSEGGPYYLPYNYRSDVMQIRRYI